MIHNFNTFNKINEKAHKLPHNILVDIPLIDKTAYKKHEIPLIIKKINSIKSKYRTIIDKISNSMKIPKDIIISVIFIESSGNKNAKSNSGAIGLMQLKPDSAADIVNIKKRKYKLTSLETSILKNNLEEDKYKCLINMPYAGKYPCGENPITEKDLVKEELNILIGTMYLKLLISKLKENGKLRLDKVIAKYNQGYFRKTPTGNYEDFYNKVPDETKKYIVRFSGINGILDIINKNNLT